MQLLLIISPSHSYDRVWLPPPRSAPSAIRTPLSLHTPPRLTGAASPVATPVGAVLRHPHTQRRSVWLASALPSQDTHATPPHQQEEYISESQGAPERVAPSLHRYDSTTLTDAPPDARLSLQCHQARIAPATQSGRHLPLTSSHPSVPPLSTHIQPADSGTHSSGMLSVLRSLRG